MIGIRDSKAFYFEFDWPKVVDENFKHQIEFIIKSNKSLAKNKVRKEIKQLLSKYKHENNIHEHRKQQNEWTTHKFVLNWSKRLDLRSSNKRVALQSLSIYYTWKNIRKQYKNNKLKIIAPTWNDKFEFPNGSYSVSDTQDFIEYIIKKHEKLATILPVHFYINGINNRLVFKIKDGYKVELQTSETMKLFASTKKN